MSTRSTRKAPRPMLIAVWTVLVALMAWAPASAQKFQYVYGSDDKEAGRGGVRPVSEGGYIAVGESFTPDDGNTSDVYVVRTECDGSLAWSFTYDAGGNDSATDVEEVFEMIITVRDTMIQLPADSSDTMPRYEHKQVIDTEYFHNGFILTGVTDNADLPEWVGAPSRDLFLLRLDRCGNVMWWKTYGRDTTDEIGWDVDVAAVVDPANNMAWGDFIVAGSTTQHNAAGSKRNGYLLRTDRFGNIKWDRTYDVDTMKDDDYFYSLDESHVGKQINNVWVGIGDIIVAGGTYRYATTSDALIGRVNGASGLVNGPLHGFYVLKRDGDDDFRSVIERKVMNKGYIVAFGFISSAGDRDVYGVEMKEKPVGAANLNTQIAWGSDGQDEAYEVIEMPGPGSMNSALMVTGYCEYDEGFGGKDAFLQEIDPFTFMPATNIWVYGGTGTDWGWSLSHVPEYRPDPEEPPCMSTGFVVAGFTDSPFPEVQDQDLYLIKTDRNKSSGCNEVDFPIETWDPPINDRLPIMYMGQILRDRPPVHTRECNDWEAELCYDDDGTGECELNPCMPCMPPPPPPNDSDTVVVQKRISTISFNNDGALSSYPNPVERGEPLSLRYALPASGEVTVTVSDLLGKVIYESTDRHAAGTMLQVIPTDAWRLGTYLIRVRDGERSAMMRVVVVDR